jgi:hypothetical protein
MDARTNTHVPMDGIASQLGFTCPNIRPTSYPQPQKPSSALLLALI